MVEELKNIVRIVTLLAFYIAIFLLAFLVVRSTKAIADDDTMNADEDRGEDVVLEGPAAPITPPVSPPLPPLELPVLPPASLTVSVEAIEGLHHKNPKWVEVYKEGEEENML